MDAVTALHGPSCRHAIRRRIHPISHGIEGTAVLYRWDDWCLDREAASLTVAGRPVEVPRKVLDCLVLLIENRHRVLGYDELIRGLWGHDNVTNHQLSQVILATRRTLGDNGQAQRLIRTLPGLGYRWMAEVVVETPMRDAAAVANPPPVAERAAPQAAGPASSAPPVSAMQAPAAKTLDDPPPRRRPPRSIKLPGSRFLHLGLLLSLCTIAYLASPRTSETPSTAVPAFQQDAITRLEAALREGDYERVREGLATLPEDEADSIDARLLAIRLDLKRGRQQQARQKLEEAMASREAGADPLARAKLMIAKSEVDIRSTADPGVLLANAEATLALVRKLPAEDIPANLLAQAIERRGIALIYGNRLEDALRDFAQAGDLYQRDGDRSHAIGLKARVARVWMRMGRLQDALEKSREAAEAYRSAGDPVGEIFARNTMSRIQMELLRWDDALASNDRSLQLMHEVPDTERRYRTLQLRAEILTAKGALRLAAAQLEEADAAPHEEGSEIIPALHLLESGNDTGALAAASRAYASEDNGDPADILLDGKEGALLIWMTAARAMTRTGAAMPAPTADMIARLETPRTIPGRIARGRWLWSRGQIARAETELRAALAEARRMNQLYRMTLAAESLVGLLLQEGKSEAAADMLADLRVYDQERLDGDYRFNLMRLDIATAKGDAAGMRSARHVAQALSGERTIHLAARSAQPAAGLD
jgi:DNA-binding winged helix-turn-helix (wHTH) protein/tetratricopeptide (TPR) repeat protein